MAGDDRRSGDRREDGASLGLKAVRQPEDVLPAYRHTPIAALLAAHGGGGPREVAGDFSSEAVVDVQGSAPAANASMIIITCMDSRLLLRIGEEGAFVIRTAGAAPEPAVSNIAFAVAVAGLKTICVIGHTDCAMMRTEVAQQSFVQHMMQTEGWSQQRSDEMFENLRTTFAIADPIVATHQRAVWLRQQFPSCLVAPLLYRVEDHALLQIVEEGEA